MDEILVLGGVISGVVFALVELIKHSEVVPPRFLPYVGLAVGLTAGYAAFPFTELDLVMRLWAGLVAGLGATGFYEVVKGSKKEENSDERYYS